MAARVTGPGPAELKLTAARLKEATPAVRRDFRRNMRSAGDPAVKAARKSILSMPSHHDGTLRKEIAGTVSTSVGAPVRSGVRVEVVSDGRKMPAGKQNLNGYTEQPQGWNHPVFGRPMAELVAHMTAGFSPKPRSGRAPSRQHGRGWAWVRQTGKPFWFSQSIARGGQAARAACEDTMRQAKTRLGG
jgi:hypothetical protein